MASISGVLQDNDGNDLYPYTFDQEVLDANNVPISQRLGSASEASAVAGNSAFAKINTLSSELTDLIGANPTSISYCNGFLNFGSGVTNPTAIAQKLLTDITIPSGTVSNISVIVLTNSLWQIDGYCNDGKTFASLTLKRYDGSFYLFYRSGTTDTLKTINTT